MSNCSFARKDHYLPLLLYSMYVLIECGFLPAESASNGSEMTVPIQQHYHTGLLDRALSSLAPAAAAAALAEDPACFCVVHRVIPASFSSFLKRRTFLRGYSVPLFLSGAFQKIACTRRLHQTKLRSLAKGTGAYMHVASSCTGHSLTSFFMVVI